MENCILKLEILSGDRLGKQISLPVKSESDFPVHWLKEDESFRVLVTVPEYFTHVTMAIGEQKSEATEWRNTITGRCFIWVPHKGNNNYTPYFRNYFGLVHFKLDVWNQKTEAPEAIVFSAIEVLAKKSNAEKTSQMLDFLSRKTFPIHQEGRLPKPQDEADNLRGKTPAQKLDMLEGICRVLEGNIPVIARRPLTRLRQHRGVEPVYGACLNASEVSLQWLAQNTDELIPEIDQSAAHLQVEEQLYRVNRLLVQKPANSTDIPENARILGVLQSIHQQVADLKQSIKNRIALIEKKGCLATTDDHYISFFSCMSKHVRYLNQARLKKCDQLTERLAKCSYLFSRSVSVRQPDFSLTLSEKAKLHPAYRSVMQSALSLYSQTEWGQEDIFLTIYSIPKLYELFCLEQIKEALISIPEMKSKPGAQLVFGSSKGCHGAFTWGAWSIHFEYQPILPTKKTGDALSLVNTEGWTKRYNGTFVERVRNRREPDFIIDIRHNEGDQRFVIILDAKYTNAETAYTRDLPNLVMKYVHGLHLLKGGLSPVVGLFILFPENDGRSFHHNYFSVTSEQPALPVLTTLSMSPEYDATSNHLGRHLHHLIRAVTTQNEKTVELKEPIVKQRALA